MSIHPKKFESRNIICDAAMNHPRTFADEEAAAVAAAAADPGAVRHVPKLRYKK